MPTDASLYSVKQRDGWEAIMRNSITQLIIGTAVAIGRSVTALSDRQQIEGHFLDGPFR
jgi:hypothetical protein